MDKEKYTPSQKKVIFIFALMLFLPLIGSYFAVKYDFQDDNVVIVLAFVIASLFVYYNNKAKKEESALHFLDELKEMEMGYFKDVDAEKKNYKGSWSVVEEWKEKMNKETRRLAERFKKEGETSEVLEDWENLEYELNNGLRVIQDGNNPLTVKVGQGREMESLSLLGKIVVPLLIILPIIFLYLVLSGVGWGILVLTITFPWFLFNLEQFKFRYWIYVLLMGVPGYFLNQWTYAQLGEVQIAVTVGLPIIYGLIYYMLKCKKTVREI